MIAFPDKSTPLTRLRDRLSRIVSGLVHDWPLGRRRGVFAAAFPPVALIEEGDALILEALAPGLRLEDLDVTVQGRELVLRGSRPDVDDRESAYRRRERFRGPFTRVFSLPVDVEAEGVHATLENGILTLILPKAPHARPRKIPIPGAPEVSP